MRNTNLWLWNLSFGFLQFETIHTYTKMLMKICNYHFQELKVSKLEEIAWKGRIPRNWFNTTKGAVNYFEIKKLDSELSDQNVSRTHLFEMVKNKDICTPSCCISILAWGGMRKTHGERLFSNNLDWLELAHKIRLGGLDRAGAFQKFTALRADGKLPGMGPAYFTKLIFFLCTNSPRGYIMDQWTSASINLLYDSKIVQTTISRQRKGSDNLVETVLDRNLPEDYELFCKGIEKIAERLEVIPEYAEEMMFSNGGAHKGHWRKHVINERLKAYKSSNSHN